MTTNTFRTPHILLLLFLSIGLPLASLFSQPELMRWGKVPDAHISTHPMPSYPEAPAIVLGDQMQVVYDFVDEKSAFRYRHHRRIKIMSHEGLACKEVRIRFHEYDNLEKITDVDAHTIKADGRVISLKKKDFRVEKTTKAYSDMVFTLPDVEPGDIIEYKYQLISYIENYIKSWLFQTGFPTLFSDFFFEYPTDFYDFEVLQQGTLAYSHASTERYRKTFSIREEVEEIGLIKQGVLADPTRGVNRKQSSFDPRMVGLSYRMENVPPIYPEKNATTPRDHSAMIRFYKSFVFENEVVDSKILWWFDVSQDLASRDKFGGQYLRQKFAKEILKKGNISSKPKGKAKDSKVIEKSFDLVQSMFEWNGKYDWHPDVVIPDALKTGTGNGSLINIALVSLLRYNGLDAWPALVSTRDHGQTVQRYPYTDQFNHLIAYVNLEDEEIFLDAVEPALSPGYLHTNALNNMAWVVHNTNPRWIEVNPDIAEDEIQLQTRLIDGSSVVCEFLFKKKSYSAIAARKDLLSLSHQEYTRSLFDPDLNIEHMEMKRVEVDDLTTDLVIEGSYKLPGPLAEGVNEQELRSSSIYFFPEKWFRQDQRNLPFDLPYGQTITLHSSIQWPEGWELKSYPQNIDIKTEDSFVHYTSSYKKLGNGLQRTVRYSIQESKVPASVYDQLQTFHLMIVEDLAVPVNLIRMEEGPK